MTEKLDSDKMACAMYGHDVHPEGYKPTLADVQPGGRVRLGDRPKDGEVLVEVSGLTGSGKSAIAGEIEILCKTLGLEVEWVNGDEEKRLTHADWIGALEMYKPKVVIVEQNIPRAALAAQPSPGGQGETLVTDAMVEAAHAAYWAHPDDSGEDRPCIRAALEAALAGRQPVCPTCEKEGVFSDDGSGPWDCYTCGKKAAARQPVGEPVVKSVGIDALAKLLEDEAAECERAWVERADTYMSGRASGFLLAADHFRKIATSQRWSEFLSSPAQAVDLGMVERAMLAHVGKHATRYVLDDLRALIDSKA